MKYRGFEIEIVQDTDGESPRDWDNLGTIAYKHRRYDLGEERVVNPVDWLADKLNFTDDFLWRKAEGHPGRTPYCRDFFLWLEEIFLSEYIALPVYLYDHGGLTIRTGAFGSRWDSGQIGYIYADKDTIREEYSCQHVTKSIRERALKVLQAEIGVYNEYLQGEVFGYITRFQGEIIDSCFGFYSLDHEKSGLLPNAKCHIDWVLGKHQELSRQTWPLAEETRGILSVAEGDQ